MNRLVISGMVVLIATLSGCQALISGEETETDSGQNGAVEAEAIESIGSDPLVSAQWALYNSGQRAYADAGGFPAEDMNGFSSNHLTQQNYALGYTGDQVEIAILDTGLEIRHPDLINNVLSNGSYNFSTSNQRISTDPTNDSGIGDHGTSVAGIAAARGNNSLGLMGVAPKAKLRAFNILSYGGLEEELAALGVSSNYDFDVSNVGVFNRSYGYNPDIVSDGTDEDGVYMQETLAALKLGTETLRDGKGALYVKAGGNEYENGVQGNPLSWCTEARDAGLTCYNVNQELENATPYQIVVGAYNADGKRASYSNTGSALWLVAPGGEYGDDQPALVTTDQSGCFSGYSKSSFPELTNAFNLGQTSDNSNCDYYSAFNGTSAATPMVSGVVALILEANPNLKWFEVKHILAATARQIDPELADNRMTLNGQSFLLEQGWQENAAGFSFSNEYGFGSPDIIRAVTMAKEWKRTNHSLGQFKSATEIHSITSEIAIPDFDASGISLSMTMDEPLTVQTMTVQLSIEGKPLEDTFNESDLSDRNKTSCGLRENAVFKNKIDASDFWVQLTSPNGTKSVLLTPLNAYRSGYNMPNLTLATHAFYGESSVGEWTIKIVDADHADTNYICHSGQGWLTDLKLTVYGYE